MVHSQFVADLKQNNLIKGVIKAQAPSNIALVKYWGKHGQQLPKNSSISFTLSDCKTTTSLEFLKKDSSGFDFDVFLDDKLEPSFKPKIETFFKNILPYCPFIESYSFVIRTHNSFPHSSGIASSASGMSALSSCLIELENMLSTKKYKSDYKTQKASFLARLGSGSACRSLEGPLVTWGEHPDLDGSSDLFGSRLQQKIAPIFDDYRDSILLVDKGQKQVSSTIGHGLMHDHPFANERFKQANSNISKLLTALSSGDLLGFIEIVESEALSLHAMMMTSLPYFILFKPNTLKIIEAIWEFRKASGLLVCFTLDAGANVHVLYPSKNQREVQAFIVDSLAQFCENQQFIHDRVGMGAQILS